MTFTGTIKHVDPARGFGFVSHPHGVNLFFHYSNCDEALLPLSDRLKEQLVQYETEDSAKGKRAVNLRPI